MTGPVRSHLAPTGNDHHRPRHQLVAAALVDNGRVLLCLRRPDREWYPSTWDLAGGHVEQGETPSEALAREIQEELAVVIEPPISDPVATYFTADAHMSVWAYQTWSGTPVNAAPHEHDAIGWFGPEQLLGLPLAHPRYLGLLKGLVSAEGRGKQTAPQHDHSRIIED